MHLLFKLLQLFEKHPDASLKLFCNDEVRIPEKQEHHTLEAVKLVEYDLKQTLEGLARYLFGKGKEKS